MSDYPENRPSGLTIREMPDEQKPREKAMIHGLKALSDAELMAIVFATGIRGKSVLQMSEDIIADFDGHLSRLTALDVKELCKRFKGIGPAKALTLLAGLELGVRAALDGARLAAAEQPLTSPETIWTLMKEDLQGLEHEEFWVLFLKQSGHLIKRELIGRGGLTSTVVDVRLILREALMCLASSIILVHNHPSGNLRPSEADKVITRKLKEAAALHDIRVFDHIIFTDKAYFSFHNEGLMG
ncbi:MAG: DNA repair protein RadC [Muribaculaceae bacterium]|nr:DNA repair protein RadC [Muribaculaceae bacterium]